MTVPDPSTVYRDATISRQTRDHLNRIRLVAGPRLTSGEKNALADVVARWDANDATEIILTDDGSFRDAA